MNFLNRSFRSVVNLVLEECEKEGIKMVPYKTFRSPEEQAKLWRQSRPTWKIRNRIQKLRNYGLEYIPDIIENVGPSSGPHATNAIPGMSFHQFGHAVDCYWEIEPGKAEWSTVKKVDGKNGYEVYANIAKKYGLESGHFWSFRDSPHIQSFNVSNPMKLIDLDSYETRLKVLDKALEIYISTVYNQ